VTKPAVVQGEMNKGKKLELGNLGKKLASLEEMRKQRDVSPSVSSDKQVKLILFFILKTIVCFVEALR
jgi:hypothetical protein